MNPNPPVSGLDIGPWRAAQAALAPLLAEAAMAAGRLDATLASLPRDAAQGAIGRLALIETETMLWAEGLVLGRDEIGRDLAGARAGSDPQAMRLARWTMRRLVGQGRLADLPGFLGLYRGGAAASGAASALPEMRPRGADFDDAASEFLSVMGGLAGLHPLSRGPLALMAWRLAGLSPPERVAESAAWSARDMAQGFEALAFLPLGRHGRRVWTAYGPPEDRLAAHLAGLRDGATEARSEVLRLCRWADAARAATATIKGANPARVIEALAARPLLSAPEAEAITGLSRITAERMLNRMTAMGLIREVTGGRRFRLWTARLEAA